MYEWRPFTTVEDLKQNGLYAGNGMYYAAGDFSSGPWRRPATLYGRNGMCSFVSPSVPLATNCKYLVDDGNFELVTSSSGAAVQGAVRYNNFYGIGRVLDAHGVLHVGLIIYDCLSTYEHCVWWGNYAGQFSYPAGEPYEALVYKPLKTQCK